MSINTVSSEGTDASVLVEAPHGLQQIIETFGYLHRYIRADGTLDPRWEAEFLVHVHLPFRLALSWDTGKSVERITCHKKVADVLAGIFEQLAQPLLRPMVKTLGGCFSFRQQRGGTKFSTHCWGIAIDLNPETNGLGTEGDMDAQVVAVFRGAGFQWGGDWEGHRRDPMHFQYCTGY